MGCRAVLQGRRRGYAAEVRQQVTEKEAERVRERQTFFTEGRALDEEAEARRRRLDDIKQRKLQELQVRGRATPLLSMVPPPSCPIPRAVTGAGGGPKIYCPRPTAHGHGQAKHYGQALASYAQQLQDVCRFRSPSLCRRVRAAVFHRAPTLAFAGLGGEGQWRNNPDRARTQGF
jgi:hypothetical protein